MENVSNVTEIARGIGDVGMMAITAAIPIGTAEREF